MTKFVLILTIDVFKAEHVVSQVGIEPTHPGFMPSALPIELPERQIICSVEVYNIIHSTYIYFYDWRHVHMTPSTGNRENANYERICQMYLHTYMHIAIKIRKLLETCTYVVEHGQQGKCNL